MIKIAVTLIVSFIGIVLMIKKNTLVSSIQETASVQKKDV